MSSPCNDLSPEMNDIIKQYTTLYEQFKSFSSSLNQEEIDILNELNKLAGKFAYASKMASVYHLNRLLLPYTYKCGEIYKAVQQLSVKRRGALIIVQRDDPIDPHITKGIPLDSDITSSLLDSIFHVGSPLHDGAVWIRRETLVSAANILPLTKKSFKGKKIGTRHRAAIGLSEQTDALVFVVSEETGRQSFAYQGSLYRFEVLQS